MKDGKFVFDAHSGDWDASAENCKNRFGDAFIETFYAFHTGFNPPDPKWTMDYERQFRKVDPEWYLEEMFVKGNADMSILSTQVLMDFYHTGFVNPERNAQLASRFPDRIIPLGGVDPRMPNAGATRAAGRPTTRWSIPATRKPWSWASPTTSSTRDRPWSRSPWRSSTSATSTSPPGCTRR